MTSSTIAKFLIISMPFISSTAIFAAADPALQNQASKALRSIRPVSTNELQHILLKPQKDSTTVAHAPLHSEVIYGGGYGGNEQTGILIYDGLPSHLAALTIKRDNSDNRCFLENQNAGVYHYNFWGSLKLVSYDCPSVNKYHNGVYWHEELDTRNGGYSTDNDALYASIMVNKMYEQWFGISVSQNTDSPLPVKIVTQQSDLANAYLENQLLILGDGGTNHYPYTSPGIISFMMAFIFTEQHSNLNFVHPTAGAISIAFCAMADQALKFYIHGENDWQVGNELSKTGQPLYYMDQPSKDCASRSTPGDNCSIDHMSQYQPTMNTYHASGLYRRAFYLLATTPNWDVKKAFSIMVQANRFYWTNKQDFSQGVCGLIKAARDLQYDQSAVIEAFKQVGVTSQNC